jgi:hypothetical protein
MRAPAHHKLIVSDVSDACSADDRSESEPGERVSMIQPMSTRSELKARAAMVAVCFVSAVLLCLAFKP